MANKLFYHNRTEILFPKIAYLNTKLHYILCPNDTAGKGIITCNFATLMCKLKKVFSSSNFSSERVIFRGLFRSTTRKYCWFWYCSHTKLYNFLSWFFFIDFDTKCCLEYDDHIVCWKLGLLKISDWLKSLIDPQEKILHT